MIESTEEFNKLLEESNNPYLELFIRFLDLMTYPEGSGISRENIIKAIEEAKSDPAVEEYIKEKFKNEL